MTEPSDFVGTTVGGKYELTRVVGIGGMGAVYEATHTEIGKRVAVKVISSDFAQSPEVERRFRREARAASAVESEHIVQVFDAGRDPVMGLYMVMEYLVGEDLSERLARTGSLPLEEAVDLACQALRGLLKAHAAGVVHRDLKPANLFLIQREDGSLLVKLLDFGVSKVLRDAKFASMPPHAAALTRVGSAIGTPQYMSPEQAQGLPTVDHRTDIWSMGAVLHEALVGTPPYDEMPTYEQTIIRIVTQLPRPLRDVAPSIPPSLATVVDQMLKHDVDQRIALSAAMRAMLDVRASLGLHPRQPFASFQDLTPVPEVVSAGLGGTVPVGIAARPPTSAAVVLEASPGRTDVRPVAQDSAPPRPSDLPGVASSRRRFYATLAVFALLLTGVAGTWYLTRGRTDSAPIVAPATLVASSVATSPAVALPEASAEPSGSHAPALVVLEPADADAPVPAAPPRPQGTSVAGKRPGDKTSGSSAGGKKKGDEGVKEVPAEATAEKPPPPAPTQYGGVGVAESY